MISKGAFPPHDAIEDLEVFVTADQGFPALETAFLNAEHEISASFRIFDLRTRLRSAQALEVGDNWLDLVAHTLQRGVSLRIVIADFDAHAAPDLHRGTWRTVRQFAVARELAGSDAKLQVIAARHPARIGLAPRLAFEPLIRYRIHKILERVRKMRGWKRTAFLRETPGLRSLFKSGRETQSSGRLLAPLAPVTHHQKMAVFDKNLLIIGGLDLNERRFDTPEHNRAADQTWHDVLCQCRGSVVSAASGHLDTFLDTVEGGPPLPQDPGYLRTLSKRRSWNLAQIAPQRVVGEIEQAHLRGIEGAQDLIYLESQYFRHIPLARALARRARACPTLRLIVLLPAAPDDVAFDNSGGVDARLGEYLQARCLKIVKAAFGARLLVVSPVQPRRSNSDGRDALADAPIIYVHSKVSIFDTQRAIVSSANLNGRSLRWDTEAGLDLCDPSHVALVRDSIMNIWLPPDDTSDPLETKTAFDSWSAQVARNANLRPEDRRGFLVPYDLDPASEFGTPFPVLPDEMV